MNAACRCRVSARHRPASGSVSSAEGLVGPWSHEAPELWRQANRGPSAPCNAQSAITIVEIVGVEPVHG